MLKENNRQQFQEIEERLRNLESVVFGTRNKSRRTKELTNGFIKIDFDMPIRAFIKKYAKRMSGPKKFTLLLSWFTKGSLEKEISFREIKDNWNKMTATHLLGGKFNRFYSAEARVNDWVDSRRKGFYILRPSWHNIFNGKIDKEK